VKRIFYSNLPILRKSSIFDFVHVSLFSKLKADYLVKYYFY